MDYLVEGVIGSTSLRHGGRPRDARRTRRLRQQAGRRRSSPVADARRAEGVVIPLAALARGLAGVQPVPAARRQVARAVLRADLARRLRHRPSPARTRCRARRPLLLAALCVALPARLGLVVIGGEGAIVLGGVAAAAVADRARRGAGPPSSALPLMALAAMADRRRSGSARSARCATSAASTRRSPRC